jgi:hypothetical protein
MQLDFSIDTLDAIQTLAGCGINYLGLTRNKKRGENVRGGETSKYRDEGI